MPPPLNRLLSQYNTKNYMKNKARFTELGIFKSIELPESAETAERKMKEAFVLHRLNEKLKVKKGERRLGIDEVLMQRVLEQRAAWKNGTWTRSTRRTMETVTEPPTGGSEFTRREELVKVERHYHATHVSAWGVTNRLFKFFHNVVGNFVHDRLILLS